MDAGTKVFAAEQKAKSEKEIAKKTADEKEAKDKEKAELQAREEAVKKRKRELEEKQRRLDEENARVEASKKTARDEKRSSEQKGVVAIAFADLDFVEQIGGGGFGQVWKGKWKSMGNETVCHFAFLMH